MMRNWLHVKKGPFHGFVTHEMALLVNISCSICDIWKNQPFVTHDSSCFMGDRKLVFLYITRIRVKLNELALKTGDKQAIFSYIAWNGTVRCLTGS